MACRLVGTPSHYLNQCWNTDNWTLRDKIQWNFKRNPYILIKDNVFECVNYETAEKYILQANLYDKVIMRTL